MRCRRFSTANGRRAAGGRFLLRIEDIDLERCTPEYEQGIYDDLAWLGIDWEKPARRQSRAFRRVQDRSRPADPRGARLSRLHEPRRDPRLHLGGRDAEEAMAARSRRRAALSRRRPRAVGARAPAAHRRRARPTPGGSTWRQRSRASRSRCPGPNSPTSLRTTTQTIEARPAAMGRRRAGPQGRADQLPSVGCRRRRRARRQPRRARPRPLRGDRRSSGCCRSCSAIPRPPISTTSWSKGRTGASCRRARTTRACSALRESGATPADIRRMVGLADKV